jgi:hypothetical protein
MFEFVSVSGMGPVPIVAKNNPGHPGCLTHRENATDMHTDIHTDRQTDR